MALWDYEGKLESRRWSCAQEVGVFEARLSSPPAKMLRCFVQAVCDAILQKFQVGPISTQLDGPSNGLKGLTADVPFSPLEEKATTRVAAAQADFAECGSGPLCVEPPIRNPTGSRC
jgi:hypothetical protein